jgi:hypothetical protein
MGREWYFSSLIADRPLAGARVDGAPVALAARGYARALRAPTAQGVAGARGRGGWPAWGPHYGSCIEPLSPGARRPADNVAVVSPNVVTRRYGAAGASTTAAELRARRAELRRPRAKPERAPTTLRQSRDRVVARPGRSVDAPPSLALARRVPCAAAAEAPSRPRRRDFNAVQARRPLPWPRRPLPWPCRPLPWPRRPLPWPRGRCRGRAGRRPGRARHVLGGGLRPPTAEAAAATSVPSARAPGTPSTIAIRLRPSRPRFPSRP